MKKLLLFIVTVCICNTTFSQSESNIPKGLDGILEFENGNRIDFSRFNNYITRLNNVSLNLDKLIYWTEAKGEFYIHLEVNYYNWEKGKSKPEPSFSFSRLFKETIENEKSIHELSQIKLTSSLPLENITNVEIISKIVKKNDKQKEINKILKGYINSSITSSPTTEIINKLVDTQKREDDDYLVFKSDYDIPLNSIEFANKVAKIDSNRVIYNNAPIFIPINKDVDDNLLKPSVLQAAFDGLSALTGVISGETFSTKETPFEGMIKIHFTADDNLNIPFEIKKGIDDMVFSINSDENWETEFSNAKNRLWSTLKTVRISESFNYRLIYGIKEFLILSDSYKDLMINETQLRTDLVKFQVFQRKFKDFYDDLSFLENTYGFVSYGIENIYGTDKYARIYIPYGLDERTMKLFIKWQVSIHQLLAEQAYDAEYKLITE